MPPAVIRCLLGAWFSVRLCKGYSPSSSPGALLPSGFVSDGSLVVSTVLCVHDVIIFNFPLPAPYHLVTKPCCLSVCLFLTASLFPSPLPVPCVSPHWLPGSPWLQATVPGHPPYGHPGDLQKGSLHLCSETSDDPLHPTSDQIRSVAQSCPTFCDPMNCSTPGPPTHSLKLTSIELVMPSSHLCFWTCYLGWS